MEESIGDEAAMTFAGQLYSSIGFGLPLEQAFEQAKVQVGLTDASSPGAPQLHTAPGIDADTLVLVAPPSAEAA